MRPLLIPVLVVALGLAPLTGSAQEPVAKSKIVSVGVFKNGLALVQQEIQVPGAGTYRLDTAPNPVHGTFWIKSNCQVEAPSNCSTSKRPGRWADCRTNWPARKWSSI